MDDIFDISFDIICESITARILNISGNLKLKMALTKLEHILSDNNSYIQKNDINITESNEDNNNTSHSSPETCFCLNCDKNDSLCFDFYENRDNVSLNFMNSLKNLIILYDDVKQYNDDSKILFPPPVPVTTLFRIHNPEASNIFDYHNTLFENRLKLNEYSSFSNGVNKIIKDSLHTCLVQPNYFTRLVNNPTLSYDSIFDSLNLSDSDTNSYYDLLKVLFGWYFSGYYTARMELLTRTD